LSRCTAISGAAHTSRVASRPDSGSGGTPEAARSIR